MSLILSLMIIMSKKTKLEFFDFIVRNDVQIDELKNKRFLVRKDKSESSFSLGLKEKFNIVPRINKTVSKPLQDSALTLDELKTLHPKLFD
jgi:hypothetical protein